MKLRMPLAPVPTVMPRAETRPALMTRDAALVLEVPIAMVPASARSCEALTVVGPFRIAAVGSSPAAGRAVRVMVAPKVRPRPVVVTS